MNSVKRSNSTLVVLATVSVLCLGFSDLLLPGVPGGNFGHPLVLVPGFVMVQLVLQEISEHRSLKAFVIFIGSMLLTVVRGLTANPAHILDAFVLRAVITVVIVIAVVAPASWPISKLDREQRRE